MVSEYDKTDLELLFTGDLTVTETPSGKWWVDFEIPVFEVQFVKKISDNKYLFNMKGFFYPQIEHPKYGYLEDGQSAEYPFVPVMIDVSNPEKPTYTVTKDPESEYEYPAVIVTDPNESRKNYWFGFMAQENKEFAIDYDNRTMTMDYNITGLDWTLDFEFVLNFKWE